MSLKTGPVALGAALLCATWVSARGTPAPPADAPPDFVRDVQPILVRVVRALPRPERQQGPAAPRHAEGTSTRAASPATCVVPGDPAASLLYQKLVEPEPEAPHAAGGRAARTRQQIETIRRWIEAGAPWPEGVTVTEVADARRGRASRAPTARPRDPDRLSYNRDVRPILAESCFACHGPDQNRRKAGLRLDREEMAKATLASGAVAVVAGAPEQERAPRPHRSTPTRRAACRSRRAGRPRLPSAAGRRRCGAGSRRAPSGSRTGPTSRPSRPDAARPPATRAGRANAVDAFVLAGLEAAGLAPLARGRARRAAAPPELRPHRPAARRRRRSAPSRRTRAHRRLRAPGRPAARVAALRRADGRLLARPRPLRRQRRLPQRQRAADVALPRLGHRRLQPQPAVRPLHRRAARRRPAARARRFDADGSPPATTGCCRRPRRAARSRRSTARSTSPTASATPRASWLGATLGCAQCHDHKFDPYLARATSTPSPPSSPT